MTMMEDDDDDGFPPNSHGFPRMSWSDPMLFCGCPMCVYDCPVSYMDSYIEANELRQANWGQWVEGDDDDDDDDDGDDYDDDDGDDDYDGDDDSWCNTCSSFHNDFLFTIRFAFLIFVVLNSLASIRWPQVVGLNEDKELRPTRWEQRI